jgi:hypothetical protein
VSVGGYGRRSREVRGARGGYSPAVTLVMSGYELPYVQSHPAGNWPDSGAIAAAWMGAFLSVSDAPKRRTSASCSWARK